MPAGTQDAGNLLEHRFEVRHVRERQRAEHHVHPAGSQGHRLEIGLDESPLGDLSPSDDQHLL